MENNNGDELRIPFDALKAQFEKILMKLGFETAKANTCAEIFTENSLDGVYTHGVNRFPRFVEYVKQGHIIKDAAPTLKNSFGAVEQWDGNSGIGISNALFCTDRAVAIAEKSGIGCVTISNTNHWMRGGTYGWNAAKRGFAFICWTNTIANMPPWGAKDARLGNNPLVLAVPYENEAIVLDMAMSQFSFGKMELKQMEGEKLPVPGGFDKTGKMTDDPAAILQTNRAVPIGYWKGAGLSLLLDVLATILSGGLSTSEITKQEAEKNVSQVFIALDLSKFGEESIIKTALKNIIADYNSAEPVESNKPVHFPGEGVLQTRKINLEKGIPVNEKVWKEILDLEKSFFNDGYRSS